MTADATALVHAAPSGLHRIELEGAFPHPHWLAFLCGGLSAAGVAVVSGSAVRQAPMRWEGHFLVDGRLDGLDVVALAGQRPPLRDAAAPRLESFEVTRRPDLALDLVVDASDALGFLGRLLSRISLITLLPVELEIATVAGRIRDRFVLTGIGSAAPSDEVLTALRDMLTGMLPT